MKKLVKNSLKIILVLPCLRYIQFLKIPLTAVFMVFLLSVSYAQDEDCLDRLEEAENMFNTGVFEDIPGLPDQCIKTFEAKDKLKAFRLIILAQYLNDDIAAAEETMHELLKEFPDYKPAINDLADYQLVYRSFKVKNVFDIGGFTGPVLGFGSITEPWSPFNSTFTYSIASPGIVAGKKLAPEFRQQV